MTKPKRKRKANSLFKNFYVMCDGKKFGPYKTKAKANKVGLTIARVLDKPAKIMAQPKSVANPRSDKQGYYGDTRKAYKAVRSGRVSKAIHYTQKHQKRKAKWLATVPKRNPGGKYVITATPRSTGRPKFKTVSASSMEMAERKARTWLNSAFKKSGGPVDFTIHSSR